MKKVLALVLAAMMVIGIAPMTFAAADGAIGLSGSDSVVNVTLKNNFVDGNMDLPRPDARIWIFLADSKGNFVTKSDMKDYDVKTKFSSGTKAVDTVTIQYEDMKDSAGKTVKAAYIRVKFVENFVSTKDLDYKFTIYLTYKKSKISGTEIDFEGTLANASQTVYEDDDYVYLGDYPIVEAKEYIKAIEVDLGNGVSINTKFFEGKKYYGYATQKVKSEDDETVSKYPDIDTIYYLDTINLNSSGNTVNLDIDDKLYVYNADLEYIGMTNEKLPYSTKYYVASKELDVEGAGDTDVDDGPSDTTDEPVVNPDMGGDDVPENVNDNPGTGR